MRQERVVGCSRGGGGGGGGCGCCGGASGRVGGRGGCVSCVGANPAELTAAVGDALLELGDVITEKEVVDRLDVLHGLARSAHGDHLIVQVLQLGDARLLDRFGRTAAERQDQACHSSVRTRS